MKLHEVVPAMRELGVRRATFSMRGDVLEADLLPDAPAVDVVPLPPLDPLPALDTPAATPPTTVAPEAPPRPVERPADPGEAQALARFEEAKRRRRAQEDAQREHDRVLFAASGAFVDTRLIRTDDEDELPLQ